MNLNATLFGQLFAFGIFLAGCYHWLWPRLISILDERRTSIAEGLAAAERGVLSLKLAQENAAGQLKKARQNSQHLLEEAHQQSSEILRRGRQEAEDQCSELLRTGAHRLEEALSAERRKFEAEAVALVISATERVIRAQGPQLDEAAIIEAIGQCKRNR